MVLRESFIAGSRVAKKGILIDLSNEFDSTLDNIQISVNLFSALIRLFARLRGNSISN